jgi:hypothetical protein
VMEPQVEAGNWFLPDGKEWLDDFITEFAVFPNGKHDDIVDACSQAAARFGQDSELEQAKIRKYLSVICPSRLRGVWLAFRFRWSLGHRFQVKTDGVAQHLRDRLIAPFRNLDDAFVMLARESERHGRHVLQLRHVLCVEAPVTLHSLVALRAQLLRPARARRRLIRAAPCRVSALATLHKTPAARRTFSASSRKLVIKISFAASSSNLAIAGA